MLLPSAPEPKQRLFLALWPGETERQQMAALAAQVAGRQRIRDANLHLTLVFLGATDTRQLADYEMALTDLAVPTLDLVLDRYGYWSQPRILWLGCSHTPPALYQLVADLQQRLHRCGFMPERRAFQAHITLARKYAGPASQFHPNIPIRWRMSEIALVESVQETSGSRYQVLRRWPNGLEVIPK